MQMNHKGVFMLTESETDKNGLYRIVWRCSYCTETLHQYAIQNQGRPRRVDKAINSTPTQDLFKPSDCCPSFINE